MIPVGFSVATTVFLGNAIGEGNEQKMKFYYIICLKLALIASFIQNILLFTFRDAVISIFTNREEIADLIRGAWVIFNMFVITDCCQGIASKVLTASGRQKYGALFTFVAYFTLGMPLSYLMSFYYDKGITGLWYGPTLACGFNTVVYFSLFKIIDWTSVIQQNKEQRYKDDLKKVSIEKSNDQDDQFKK